MYFTVLFWGFLPTVYKYREVFLPCSGTVWRHTVTDTANRTAASPTLDLASRGGVTKCSVRVFACRGASLGLTTKGFMGFSLFVHCSVPLCRGSISESNLWPSVASINLSFVNFTAALVGKRIMTLALPNESSCPSVVRNHFNSTRRSATINKACSAPSHGYYQHQSQFIL